jgi:hypothetical protein
MAWCSIKKILEYLRLSTLPDEDGIKDILKSNKKLYQWF